MPNFYSPNGNYEVWENKPNGYYTESEWLELHPPKEPEYSLDELKETKIAEIENAKNLANESDIEFNGKMFGAKMKDQQLLTQTITLYQLSGGLPEGFGWISADNEIVPFNDLSELIALGALIGARTNEIFIKARNLKDEVLKAKSKSAIEKIKVEF